MFKKIDMYFTDKKRLAAALAAIAFAVLWAILWNIFPMVFYAVFFAGTIGSNVQLILLNIVVLLPLFFIFTKLTASDLSFCRTVLLNILLIAAVEYVFSVFMFSDRFYICIIAYILHAAVNVPIFGSAALKQKKPMKGMRSENAPLVKAIKEQPVITIVWAAAFAFVSDALCIALMYIIARLYAY